MSMKIEGAGIGSVKKGHILVTSCPNNSEQDVAKMWNEGSMRDIYFRNNVAND